MNIILTANVSGETGTLTYVWTDSSDNILSSTGSTQVVTSADTYTVIITDSYNGSISSDNFIITNNTQEPSPSIVYETNTFTTPNQEIILSGEFSSGTGPLSYLWSTSGGTITGSTTEGTIIALSAGTYTLIVTDTLNNCSASASTVLFVSTENPPTAVITMPVGGGSGGGAGITCTNLSLTLYGNESFGIGTLTYEWTDGGSNVIGTGSTQVITSADTYTLVVTDISNGLSSINVASVTIVDNSTNPTAVISSDSTEISVSTPSIILNSSGSTGVNTLEYEWSVSGATIGSGSTQEVISASTYTLKVTDSLNGCTGTTTQIITESAAAPVARLTTNSDIISCSYPTPRLRGITSTGVLPLTYAWSATTQGSLGTTESIYATIADTYTLTVTDGNLNTDVAIKTITVNNTEPTAVISMLLGGPLDTTLDSLTPSLFYTATASTGANPLSYVWVTNDISYNTSPNRYVSVPLNLKLYVTDTVNGCQGFAEINVISDTSAPIAVISGSGTLTCDTTSITLNGDTSSGNNLSFQWKNTLGQIVGTNSTLVVTTPSTYTLKVTDGTNGLTNTTSKVIGSLYYTLTSTISAPYGIVLNSSNPSLSLTGNVTGSSSYTSSWTSVGYISGFITQATKTITITKPGTYRYTATDTVTGCKGVKDITITQVSSTVSSNITGINELNCTVTSTVLNSIGSSGVAPLTYLWSTTGGTVTTPTTSSITVTNAGTYGLLITDANNDTAYDTLVVTSNTVAPVSIITKVPDITEIPLNGSVSLQGATSTSNSGNKTYLWSTGEITSSITVTNAGTYSLTITDPDNGCTNLSQVTFTKEGSPVYAEISGPTVIDCNSIGYLEPTIDSDTHIKIYFDSSGSMNDTLAPLQTMRDTTLKAALLPHYNNDEILYNNRVTITNWAWERTFSMLNFFNQTPPVGNVIVLVFQDEAQYVYHKGTQIWDGSKTLDYDTDMLQFRNRLQTFYNISPTYYRGVVFQVDGYTAFKYFMEAVENGTGNYSGINGLSDKSEVIFNYNVTDGGTPTYYTNLITTALTNLGFTL